MDKNFNYYIKKVTKIIRSERKMKDARFLVGEGAFRQSQPSSFPIRTILSVIKITNTELDQTIRGLSVSKMRFDQAVVQLSDRVIIKILFSNRDGRNRCSLKMPYNLTSYMRSFRSNIMRVNLFIFRQVYPRNGS